MDEYGKKDVEPVAEECINLHDLLAQSKRSVDVKQEPSADPCTNSPPDVQDARDQVDSSSELDSEAAFFFCDLCQSEFPTTVGQLVIPSQKELRSAVWQLLLKRKYNSSAVEKAMCSSRAIVICREHVEERKTITVDGPENLQNPVEQPKRVKLLAIRVKRTAQRAAIERDPERRLQYRAEKRLRDYTERRLQFNAERRRKRRERKQIESEIAKAAELNGEVPVQKPRVQKSEEELKVLRAQRNLRMKLYNAKLKETQTDEQKAERRRKKRESWRKMINSNPERRSKTNEYRRLNRKPETAEQRDRRSQKDRERRERKKREREERENSGEGGRGNEENGETAEKTHSPKKVKKMLAEVECVEEQTENGEEQ